MRVPLAVLLLCLTGAPAAQAAERARQSNFDKETHGGATSLRWTYSDEHDHARTLDVSLPAAAVERDNAAPRSLPMAEAAKAQVAAVRSYAEAHKGPKITATASRSGGVKISVRGRNAGRVRDALAGAEAASEAALERWLTRNRYTRLRNDGIVPDHARLAREYADDVRPLADALADGATDARTYIERTLAFVQAIPYEGGRSGADAGYRRPLSVLARNKGDCDSKSTLFLALVEAAHPEVAASVVYVPNHAFAGVALQPEPGDRTFTRDGVRYVGVEPVGPARFPAGKVSGKAGWHLFWGSAQVRVAER